MAHQPLSGKVALVAGATRGAGRGIASMLGAAGATVYCTGRSSREQPAADPKRPETIEETAEMVDRYGGRGIARRVDHSHPEQVAALIEKIRSEQGRLDILVNDIWGGDALTEWGKPFWEHSLANGLLMQQRGVHTHLITSYYALPLMLENTDGLIVEVTDGDHLGYRGNLFYDLAKNATIRLGKSMAQELRDYSITALTITPGFLRSEAVLDHFGVTEDNWQGAIAKDPHFAESESPFFIGRAIAALAADPDKWKKSGGLFSTWGLSDEYGFADVDGRSPHWGRHAGKQLDERWEKLLEAARRQLRQSGDDTEKILEADKDNLLLKVRLDSGQWFRYPLIEVDILLIDTEKVAGKFYQMYLQRNGNS